jgi:serine/threonine protein kinase
MLYELCTGEKPFKGGDAIGTLLFQIASEPPIAPTQYRPDLASDVEAIIHKCLQKDPDQRYQRGRELAADLRSALERIKSGAPTPPPAVSAAAQPSPAAAAAASASAEKTLILDSSTKPNPIKEGDKDSTLRIEPGGTT